ncbi:serine hydrolase domain-containing protein [Phenylobacterium montanum]|uniref:Beta-lactamase family protein n=1 Tax=Phenylobacterium montanum TaxID=2823693 RepID=A0A975FYR4_9CAUL|nr:serine hydrolase domain-containing protein [Caulobacter sp. S6]QUD87649.1 beta-lactamase family protein [Caulobacter sp. S6]
MDAQVARTGLSETRLERIADHLSRAYVEPGKIAGCQVAVARHGRLAYFKSLGSMDIERGKPMADDAIFRIYSMSKPITSVALMTLFEQGYFQLDDPVSRYIPEWKDHKVWVGGDGDRMELIKPNRPMSFRDVLCHTGGLTYGSLLAALGAPDDGHPVDKAYAEHRVRRDKDETLRDFAMKLAKVPLRYHPGERWMYSLSTDVCGYLCEAISGKRFDHFLQETIFGPLEMKDTSFVVAPDKVERFAANYRRGPDRKLHLSDDPFASDYLSQPSFLSGGGGLTSTTADYLRFCEMLRRGGELDGARILGPRTIDLMRRNHLRGGAGELTDMAIGGFSETAYSGVGFGLGFAMSLDEVATGNLGAGDFYWGGAASTIFWVDQKEDLSVVFMTQLMPSGTFNFRGQLKNIIYSAIEE